MIFSGQFKHLAVGKQAFAKDYITKNDIINDFMTEYKRYKQEEKRG